MIVSYSDCNNSICLEVVNHAKEHDICIITSTCVNVLAVHAEKLGVHPDVYEPGHYKIHIPTPSRETIAVAEAVVNTIRAAGVEVITTTGDNCDI